MSVEPGQTRRSFVTGARLVVWRNDTWVATVAPARAATDLPILSSVGLVESWPIIKEPT